MTYGNGNDDFWDIEKLIPGGRRARLSPFSTKNDVVTYESPDEAKRRDERSEAERRLTAIPERGVKSAEEKTYYPEKMGLIKRVTVKRYIDKYDFYDSFRKSALLYYDCNSPRCEFAQFYSYMPQYAHLTPSQKSYYFYWRSEIRKGRYIKTDYSYLYLYVYEILNLPDKIPPDEGIRLLCNAWREYRSVLPRIDMYFSIWVEDYCLVHNLPSPIEYIGDFMFECIGVAPIKEFYLSDINEVGLSGTEALLAYLSDYDWKRGKYAGECDGISGSTLTNASYREHMTKAMYLLLSDIWNKEILSGSSKTTTLLRDAFPNSLCTHQVKCKLEVEYVSFGNLDGVRQAVSAAVRYTENKLRALLSVKSRLAVKGLPDEYRAVIDRYFDKYIKEEQRKQREASRPSYERLYDAGSHGLSTEGAAEIERMSWTTTARLVSAEDDEIVYAPFIQEQAECPEREPETVPYVAEDKSANNLDAGGEDDWGLSCEEIAFVAHLLGKSSKEDFDTPLETLAERINEAFANNFGDIIIEFDADNPAIIEDYREDVEEWLCSHLK